MSSKTNVFFSTRLQLRSEQCEVWIQGLYKAYLVWTRQLLIPFNGAHWEEDFEYISELMQHLS